jgi:hypothetical protein
LRPDTVRPPHGHRHRHNNILLLRTSSKTSEASQAKPATTVTCYAIKHMTPNQRAPINRRSCAIHFSRYPGCPISLVALRTRRQVGRPSPPNPSAPARPIVVDPGAQPRKWQEYPLTSRVSLHTLRQFGVWLGSGTKRRTRSTRLLGTRGRPPSH